MPTIFKSLTTIVAWVLFVFGLLRLLIGLVMAFASGPTLPPTQTYLDFAVGIASLSLSAVVMQLRRKLE
jgi:bacteriorhodopsin